MSMVERLWYGGDVGARNGRRFASAELAVWRGNRGCAWRFAIRPTHDADEPALPALGLGNITVGGTGRAPGGGVAAAKYSQARLPRARDSTLRGFTATR
jgi:tetraacyldisaccharide-1-P 4'-kinase